MRDNEVISISDPTTQTLSLSSLSLSNTGVYKCEVKINTSFLHTVINKSQTYELILEGELVNKIFSTLISSLNLFT